MSPCLFNSYAEYIRQNAGLDEAQAGIQTAGRNINNLRYTADTTLTAESEEELKSLLMKVKEESEKVGWKPSIQKTKIWVVIWGVSGLPGVWKRLPLHDSLPGVGLRPCLFRLSFYLLDFVLSPFEDHGLPF